MKIALRIALVVLVLLLGLLLFAVYNDRGEKQKPDTSGSSAPLEISQSEIPEESGVPDNSKEIALPFELTAKAVILYDLDKDEIVYSKNPEVSLSPASLTKIITAIVAMEHAPDLSKVLTFRKEMTDELLTYGYELADLATFDLVDGEEITMEDALNLLMIRSSNDVANLIATEVAGSIDAFVAMMNAKAAEIGALNTNFTNPHGLDENGLTTTAYDMFLISKYALDNHPFIFDVSGKYEYTLSSNKRQPKTVETYIFAMNPKYKDEDTYYPYIIGGKTGYTDDAGRCLISIATKDGKSYLMVLMGVPIYNQETSVKNDPTYFYMETKLLYEWIFGDTKDEKEKSVSDSSAE